VREELRDMPGRRRKRRRHRLQLRKVKNILKSKRF